MQGPTDPNGTATCVAGACGIDCDAGIHACSGACVDDASKDACGPSCLVCPAPPHAHSRAVCIAGQCDYTCDLGFLRCASGCCAAPTAGFARLACGGIHTCGITASGEAKCWGGNPSAQLGDGSPDDSTVPVPVAGSRAVTAIQVSASWDHSCGVDGAGAVRCWGRGDAGQLGNGAKPTVQKTGVEVLLSSGAPLLDVVALAAGGSHTCAVTAAGALACWGANIHGQLGVGTGDTTERTKASDVANLAAGAAGVSAGMGHTCALVDAGTASESLWCWGENDRGQVGDGTTTGRTTPVEVTGF